MASVGKPDKRLVPVPHPWSPIGVAPCGPAGGGPIRAMTIISVPLKRFGPLWQSAAWALDRSGTGPAEAAGQPWELDRGSGRCDSGEIGTTAVASRLQRRPAARVAVQLQRERDAFLTAVLR
jgi:hypothetical protein